MEPSSFGGARAEIAFALAALTGGCRHLCTAAVKVVAVGEMPPAETLDPLGGAFLAPTRCEAILSRVTVLRELY
jgi:hypothetical protein